MMPDPLTFAELFGGVNVPPAGAGMCNVSLFARQHIGGEPFADVLVEARHPTGLFASGSSLSLNSSVTGTTNGSGFVLLSLAREAKYRLSFRGKEGTTFSVDIEVPDAESATIKQVIP